MPEKIFLVFAAILTLQSVASLRDGFRFLRYFRSSLQRKPANFTPAAAIIVPVKGVDPDLETNLASFLTQDYPGYQLIFAVSTDRDPAHALLRERVRRGHPTAGGCAKTDLVVAGLSDDRGEKVNNLLAGISAVEPGAEVLVFADADARPARDWLRSLIAPLADAEVTVSTGFRWYLPGRGFVSRLRAAWDTSIATLLGDHRSNFAWGGSMAIRAADFKRLQIAERHWAHTVSDDYAVTRAVREVGGRIRFEPRCLMASREDSSFRDFVCWANRQIILTRVYAARLWRLGLAAHLNYCGTISFGLILLAASSLPARHRLFIAGILAGILLLGMFKGGIRSIVAREKFPEERGTLERAGSCYWMLTPIVPWVMFFNFVVAGFGRRIEWRGTQYELVSPEEVRVLSRDSG
ncbi:MAG: glycosyltransferase [Deltaproteobacteria bacterium]